LKKWWGGWLCEAAQPTHPYYLITMASTAFARSRRPSRVQIRGVSSRLCPRRFATFSSPTAAIRFLGCVPRLSARPRAACFPYPGAPSPDCIVPEVLRPLSQDCDRTCVRAGVGHRTGFLVQSLHRLLVQCLHWSSGKRRRHAADTWLVGIFSIIWGKTGTLARISTSILYSLKQEVETCLKTSI